MRRFILIVICLCASVFLFSQQSFAALQPLANLNSFDQTGTWSGASGATSGSSTNWSSSSSGSWSLGSTATIPNGAPFNTGSYPTDFYVNAPFTYTSSTINFYYNGTEYTATGSGSGTMVLHYVGGVFTSTGSTVDLKASGSQQINLVSNGTFTGFTLNNLELQGTVTSATGGAPPTNFGGNFTSMTGDITGSAVPIPGALWLLGSGLLGLVGIRRKFTKN